MYQCSVAYPLITGWVKVGFVFILVLTINTCFGQDKVSRTEIPHSFNIVDFGAVGDGKTLNTASIQQAIDRCNQMGGGTVFKSVTKGDMQGIELLSPFERLTKKFELLVTPLETQIENLLNRNSILRRTRDLLLPRLVSGEVDVSQLEIEVPKEEV